MLQTHRKLIVTVVLAAASQCAVAQKPLAPPPQIPYGLSITTESAKKVAAASIAEAKKNTWNMAIAIVDTGGYWFIFRKCRTRRRAASTSLSRRRAPRP